MIFKMKYDKMVDDYTDEQQVTWVEAGEYPIVRVFDQDRVLVDISRKLHTYRTLTLLRIDVDGEIVLESDD